ncbi:MAG: lysophospholipid acyltransferase family protein [Myxococcota bacterium]
MKDSPKALSRWSEPEEEKGWSLTAPFAELLAEVDARAARIPTRLNEYGYDRFGLDPSVSRYLSAPMVWVYRNWLRVEARGIERVPGGRVLLIANHGGNTFAWDGAMLATAMLLEAEPPRIVRGMAEYFLPTIPFFNVFLHRCGSVVGTPENCTQLLDAGEAIMVFPEGERGFVKTYAHAYELQRFGLGFMRLALETDTPIVPVGIVGSEEQSPGLANLRGLGRLIGSPAFPVTATFPFLGLAGFLPLPVKFHIHFGEAMRFEGDPGEDDAAIGAKVEVVKDAIRGLIDAGLSTRKSWFT